MELLSSKIKEAPLALSGLCEDKLVLESLTFPSLPPYFHNSSPLPPSLPPSLRAWNFS